MGNVIESSKMVKIISSLIVTLLIVCMICDSVYALPAENLELQMNDPLTLIQEQDDCEVIEARKGTTWVKLSNGNIAIYRKQAAVHGGIKYDVVEGENSASIEITSDNTVYINDEKVEYNFNFTTVEMPNHGILDNDKIEIVPYSGGWSKWTTYPLYGQAGDYTRTLKIVKKGNIRLKQIVEDLPVSVLLVAITAPLGILPGIGVTFALTVKEIYSGLNTKSLWYDEMVRKHRTSDNAIQYKITWVDSDGDPISQNAIQYAYCTFG